MGKNVLVAGRSKNVGMPIAMLLHTDRNHERPGGECEEVLFHPFPYIPGSFVSQLECCPHSSQRCTILAFSEQYILPHFFLYQDVAIKIVLY